MKYRDGINQEELFIFGNKIGDGSDDDNLQCGFISLKLLNRIQQFKNKGVFHLDETYKVVNHSFPLIVFGFTDISRKFFPVAFMLTSHEKTVNYI